MTPRWSFRFATVLALLCSLLLSGAALVVSLTRSGEAQGRIVMAGPRESYMPRMPVPFVLDDFYLMMLDDGEFVALYAFPPGWAGHTNGCRIHWEPEAKFEAYDAGNGATPLPAAQSRLVSATGLWIDGCGGSKWDAGGRKLFGPALRDLDRFPVTVTAEGSIRIDTRTLRCTGQPCERVWGRGRLLPPPSPEATP